MTLNQLLYFRETARLGHMTKAASKLHISQPSLSIALSELEKELDAPLFERDGRRIRLTAIGSVFYEHTNHILDSVNKATDQVRKMKLDMENYIRLAYISPLSLHYVPKTIREFLNHPKNENIHIDFQQDTSSVMLDKLRSDLYDIVFLGHAVADTDLVQIPVIRQPAIAAVPLHHPLTRQTSVTWEETSAYPHIFYTQGGSMRKLVDAVIDENGFAFDVHHYAPNEQSILALVENHFGISIIAKTDDIKERQVRVLELTSPRLYREVYLTYRKSRRHAASVLRFIQFIQERAIS